MAAPTTTRMKLRQKTIKKLYKSRFPVVPLTTSAGTTTTIVDTLLSPAAQNEDFLGSWTYMPTNAYGTAVTLNEVLDTSETAITVNNTASVTAGDYVMVEHEVMLVGTVDDATTLTVTRGALGSTAATHATLLAMRQMTATGNRARVTNVTTSTGTLTVAPAMSTAPGLGSEYELHYKFAPEVIHESLEEILGNIKRPILLPLSLVPDGDMEAAGVSNWDELSSATRAKTTTNVLYGRQSLEVNASAANGYAASDGMFLPPDTAVLCATDVYVAGAGSAILRLWDETNGAEIEAGTTVATGWSHIEFTATLPATCEQVKLRLVAVDAAVNVYFNNAILLPQSQKDFTYPSTLEFHEDFAGLFMRPRGSDIEGTSSEFAYRVLERKPIPVTNVTFERDDTAVVPYRISLRGGESTFIDYPLWVQGRVDFAVLTDDTTTTTVPEDIVVDLTYAQLLEDWAQEELEENNDLDRYNTLMGKALKVRRELNPRMQEFAPLKGKVIGANR